MYRVWHPNACDVVHGNNIDRRTSGGHKPSVSVPLSWQLRRAGEGLKQVACMAK